MNRTLISGCGAGALVEDAQVHVDDARVELRAGALPQPPDRLGGREPLPVGPVGRHRVERVADEDDPRLERDLLAALPVRVAGAVVALVAVPDDLADVLEAADR